MGGLGLPVLRGEGVYRWRAGVHAARIAQTQTLLIQTADAVVKASASDGPYGPVPPGFTVPTDLWGRPVQIRLDTDLLGHALIVRSLGHDGVAKSIDDIIVTRVRPTSAQNATTEAAKSILDRLKRNP